VLYKAIGSLSGSTSCSTIVAAGANCMIGATFAPLRMGTRNGSVSIVDSASSKPQVIELAGSGTVVSLLPAQLSFPPQRVGTKSTPLIVTVTNEGGTTVTVSSIGVGGTNWVSKDFSETDNCISQPLAPQASCAISITFKPKKAGPRGATLFVNDDGGGKTQTAALGGTGT
jgi:Abnormal spindle-like microcephaly-assoc'd, ASPM-SPD-2-Hydin